MKHRNKRIGLNSELFTHLRLYVTEWFKTKVANIIDVQKRPRGQNGGKGQCLHRSNSYSRVSSEHEVPNFSFIFRSHTL